jgi:hypothetical protein
MGRAEDCLDLSSNRRRGRPKRASEQQQQQLEDLQRELLAHRQYMLAQDQERERGAAFVGVGNQLTGTTGGGQPETYYYYYYYYYYYFN